MRLCNSNTQNEFNEERLKSIKSQIYYFTALALFFFPPLPHFLVFDPLIPGTLHYLPHLTLLSLNSLHLQVIICPWLLCFYLTLLRPSVCQDPVWHVFLWELDETQGRWNYSWLFKVKCRNPFPVPQIPHIKKIKEQFSSELGNLQSSSECFYGARPLVLNRTNLDPPWIAC